MSIHWKLENIGESNLLLYHWKAWEEKQEIFKSWYSGCQLCSKVDQLYFPTWHKSIGHDLPSFFSEAVVPTPCEQLLPAITDHSNGYIFYYLTSILIFCRILGNLKPYVARDLAHTFITWTSSWMWVSEWILIINTTCSSCEPSHTISE